MAFQEKITQPSQGLTGSLNGQLLINDGKAQMTLYDPVAEVYRMVIGLVDGNVIIAISKPGEDVFAALAA